MNDARKSRRLSSIDAWLAPAICVVFAALGLLSLEAGPPLWFDEGWIVTVARDWAETGYYGEFLLGQPHSASMMNVGFPAVLPIGASFSLFGVGIWQARLPSLLFTAASLYLIFYITSRLSTRRAGYLAILGLICTSTAFHPFIWGRQALGESAAVFLFLAGFALFLLRPQGSTVAVGCAALAWGGACITKVQFLPFLSAAFVGVLVLAFFAKNKDAAKLIAVALAGTWLFYFLLLRIQESLIGQEMLRQQGLYSSSALVPQLSARGQALVIALTYALPSVLSLYIASRAFLGSVSVYLSRERVARLAILAFAVSWLLWYLLLSVAWARYLYPLVFVSSIFLGEFLCELLFGSEANASGFRVPRLARALLAGGLVIGLGVQTVRGLHASLSYGNQSLLEVVHFLESQPEAKVVESYDLEVLFFLPREMRHHPPDFVQLQLNRRTFLREPVEISYRPMAADPDLLVVGHQSRIWGLYKETVKSGKFRLARRIGVYEVYQRIRSCQPGETLAAKR